MKLLRFSLIVLPLVFLAACSDEKEQRQEKQIAALSNQVERLLADQATTNDLTQYEFHSLAQALHRFESVTLIPDMGMYRIDADGGMYSFIINCEGVTPHQDGCKVRLRFGNPYTVTFEGFVLHVEWGNKAWPEYWASKSYKSYSAEQEAWRKSLRERVVPFKETLQPGTWTHVEMVFSDAKPEELGYLRVTLMDTSIISLANPQPASP
jgi:hypothetical protein